MQANTSVLLSVSLLSLLAGYYLAKWSTNAASRHPSALQQLEIVKDNTPPDSSGLIVVTRIHVAEAQALTAVDKVTTMVRDSLKYSSKVMICLGAKSVETRGLYLSELNSKLQKEGLVNSTVIIPIEPWGGFTRALDVATAYASDNRYNIIAFQSLEISISPETVTEMLKFFQDKNTLVIGPSFPGHTYKIGLNVISGRTCPWNTFALWDVKKLMLTGFPSIGNGLDHIAGGVEEVTTISLLQLTHPEWKAWLVDAGLVVWETEFSDLKRKEWHEKKMASKDSRPAAQMKALGIEPGLVGHVDIKFVEWLRP